MSQYLIIFVIVAVFRGVVWVVQKVQQNAKAREALMAQQARAQMGGVPPADTPRPNLAPRSRAADVAAPVREAARPAGPVGPAPGRTPRLPQRGHGQKRDAGAMNRNRGDAAPRAVGQASGATAARAPNPNAGGWSVARTPDRSEQGSRKAPTGRQTPPRVAPPSRADIREARVDQSSRDVRKLLLDRGSLRQAWLAREILGPPRGLTA